MKFSSKLAPLLAPILFLTVFSVPCYAQQYFDDAGLDTIYEEDVWDGSFSFGLNGKSGNSENVDTNLIIDATREDGTNTTDLSFSYFRSSNAIATTTDRIFAEARQDRKLSNPNLSWYYEGSLEWDRFKGFDYRLTTHTGLGILFFEDDDQFFKGRVGAGASREFGGINDDWIPELQFGTDWEKHLTQRTKVFATSDLFPNVRDFGDYRLNSRFGFETLVDPEIGMSLRAFVFNRYDSTPDPGFKANDIDYGLSLVFDF